MNSFKKNVIIIISVTLSTCLGMLFGMLISGGFNFQKDYDFSKNNDDNNLYTIDYILDFIQVYHLDVIESLGENIDDMNALPNQTKLLMIHEFMKNNDTYNFKEGVPSNQFEKYITKVFGANASLLHENLIYDNNVIYEYKDGVYKEINKYNDDDYITTIINQVIDYNAIHNKYEITFVKAYAWNNEVKTGSAKVYGSYIDALNHDNVIYEGDIQGDFEKTNFDFLKKKIIKQKYIFSSNLGNLVLTNYELID